MAVRLGATAAFASGAFVLAPVLAMGAGLAVGHLAGAAVERAVAP